MSVTFQLHERHGEVMRFIVSGNWTWDELYEVLDLAEKYAPQHKACATVIIDLSGASPMPENQTLHLNAMNRAKNFSARVDSLPSRVIILGSHAFLRAMYETFRGIHPTRQPDVHFLTTWAEAERFLSQPR